jgi:hypothetical protein
MEQNEAERIIIAEFDNNKTRKAFSFKELVVVLGEDQKSAKRYLNNMVESGILKWYHADTVYYERVM